MPLTLVLGPANSAKAGEVLGAYAAAAHRGALLVVPTALDADTTRASSPAGGAVLGSVLTFSGLAAEIAGRAGYARGGCRRCSASGCCAARARRGPAGGARPGRRVAGFRGRGRRADRRAAALAGDSAALRAALASLGGGDRRRGHRTRATSRRSTAATPESSERSAASTASCTRGARSMRCVRPRALGRRAGLLLRLRRPDAARARRGRDAVPGRRRAGHRVAHLRARPRGAQRPRRGGRGAAAVRRARPRAAGARRALRAGARVPRFTISSASVRAIARSASIRGDAVAPARGGRRARRGGARRRRGAELRCGPAVPGEEIVDRLPLAVADRAGDRARLRRVRDRARQPSARCRLPTLRSGSGVLALARCALLDEQPPAPRTCSPICAPRGCSSGPSSSTGSSSSSVARDRRRGAGACTARLGAERDRCDCAMRATRPPSSPRQARRLFAAPAPRLGPGARGPAKRSTRARWPRLLGGARPSSTSSESGCSGAELIELLESLELARRRRR